MKRNLAVIVFALLGYAAQASYLYWTVNESYTMENTGASYTYNGAAPYEANTFQAARLMLYDSNNESATQLGNAAGYVTEEGGAQKSYAVDVSNYTAANYSFYIELLSYDANASSWSQVGATTKQTYTQLQSANVIYESDSLLPVAAATWHGSGSMNAPEPTSAMLMLLGVAGLALRRKQRKLNEV